MKLIGQSPKVVLDEPNFAGVEDDCVYFGPLIPHYGHFIVSSLARAWFVQNNWSRHQKIICHSDFAPGEHFANTFMGRLVSSLGLDTSCFIRPDQATFFKNVTIPGPAFIEQRLAHTNFIAPMHAIGDALLRDVNISRQSRPAYFSKSKLSPPAVAKLSNENLIDEYLKEAGVDVYYPEQLSLSEQIKIFASYDKILGFAGSSFHTHVFVRNPPRITCATYDPFINANFLMLDQLNGVSVQYLYPGQNIIADELPGFAVARSILDPRAFVCDLLDVAGIAANGIFEARKSNKPENQVYNANCIPDHAGESYRNILSRLHQVIKPRAYLEIGTLTGGTLALSSSPSIAIDPKFQVASEVIGNKPLCLFYQLPSDTFFDRYDPKALLGHPVEFSFLDGMHRCEYLLRDFINAERHASAEGVIALHDCLPVEIPMTDRTQNGTPPTLSHRGGWWTGDVWRTVYLLKKRRPDLNIICLDAAPTGLVLITNLDPYSTVLKNDYSACVAEMLAMDLEDITIEKFMKDMNVISATTVRDEEALRQLIHNK